MALPYNIITEEKAEKLLEIYFEGSTSLKEEAMLKAYFSQTTIPTHLAAYKPFFEGLNASKSEILNKEIILPAKKFQIKPWWYGVAAILLVAVTVGGVLFSQPKVSQEEQEALAAFNKTKEAMLFLSANFNEGAEELKVIEHFNNSKDLILK